MITARLTKVCIEAGRNCRRLPSGIPLISHIELYFVFSAGSKEEQGLVSAQQQQQEEEEEEEGKPVVSYQLLSLPSQTLGQGQTPK